MKYETDQWIPATIGVMILHIISIQIDVTRYRNNYQIRMRRIHYAITNIIKYAMNI